MEKSPGILLERGYMEREALEEERPHGERGLGEPSLQMTHQLTAAT